MSEAKLWLLEQRGEPIVRIHNGRCDDALFDRRRDDVTFGPLLLHQRRCQCPSPPVHGTVLLIHGPLPSSGTPGRSPTHPLELDRCGPPVFRRSHPCPLHTLIVLLPAPHIKSSVPSQVILSCTAALYLSVFIHILTSNLSLLFLSPRVIPSPTKPLFLLCVTKTCYCIGSSSSVNRLFRGCHILLHSLSIIIHLSRASKNHHQSP